MNWSWVLVNSHLFVQPTLDEQHSPMAECIRGSFSIRHVELGISMEFSFSNEIIFMGLIY